MKHIKLVLSVVAAVVAVVAILAVAQAGVPERMVDQPLSAQSSTEPDWSTLLLGSTLVVRGQVTATDSHWDAGHTQIVSEHTVAIRYTLKGAPPAQVKVSTIGGVLEGENLSMVATNMPVLATGEEVILFLAPQGDGYIIAGNEPGKYLVENGLAVNRAFFVAKTLSSVYTALSAVDPNVAPPANWAQIEAAVQPEPIVGGLDYVYNNLKWPVKSLEYVVNVNSTRVGDTNGSAADFLTAINNAARSWSMVPEADFTFIYTGTSTATDISYDHANEIMFVNKGVTDANGNPMPLAVARVYYIGEMIVETDIWVNDGWNWSATGAPDRNQPDLESTVLHELGHWISLGHDTADSSIMYPRITLGTLKRALGDNDRRGIAFVYPCAVANQPCNPAVPLTPTPTPTPAPPTPTPTPTLIPTQTPTATPKPISAEIFPDTGGTLVLVTQPDLQIALDAPMGAVAVTTTLSIKHLEAAGESPPEDELPIESFAVTADQGNGELTSLTFAVPLTVTVSYSDTALAGSTEGSLVLLAHNTQATDWSAAECGTVVHDVDTHRLIVPICQLSTFGVFGSGAPALYLPLTAR